MEKDKNFENKLAEVNSLIDTIINDGMIPFPSSVDVELTDEELIKSIDQELENEVTELPAFSDQKKSYYYFYKVQRLISKLPIEDKEISENIRELKNYYLREGLEKIKGKKIGGDARFAPTHRHYKVLDTLYKWLKDYGHPDYFELMLSFKQLSIEEGYINEDDFYVI
ncbi:hypothetical protein [Flammeovirga sp. SJP92]|uniref:hypothetical protein n=1 Tax=Flammeovirga sp. SJP92 TaxID=1775430 RepID=UPI000788A17B|nr:hypothetical protein [Flammeovirga sp. SJP92]KXX70609.1 hypothetical protein AVL50_07245 [Flammeovirga sp. SJP92]